MELLVDIGNSRIKWSVLSTTGMGPQQADSYGNWDGAALAERILAPISKPDRILVANVGGDRIAGMLAEAAKARWSIRPEFVRASANVAGLHSAYRVPEQLGVDRWLCMIGAFCEQRGAVCVISVGTAMTVDTVDASGRHLGGIIVPGMELAVQSLLRNTSDLANRSQAAIPPTGANAAQAMHSRWFADNTFDAIHRGVEQMLASTANAAIDAATQVLGQSPSVFISGGDGDRIAAHLRHKHRLAPDLVLRGMAVLARA